MPDIFNRRRSRVRATRHDHKTSSSRAGHRTDGRHESASAAPLARTFSTLACWRLHESKYRERKRTRQAEDNPTAGVRELRTKHPRKRRATKISPETANVLQRGGSTPKRARRHEFVNCASPAVSSFARPGGNLSKMDAGTSLSVSGASRCHF